MFGWPSIWYLLMIHLNMFPSRIPADKSVIKATYAVAFAGFGCFSAILNVFSGSFAIDVRQKRYRKFRALPIAPSADLAGRFISGLGVGVVSFSIVLLVGYIDGAAFSLRSAVSPFIVVGTLVLFSLIVMIITLLISSLTNSPTRSFALASGLVLVSFFVTGFNGINVRMVPFPLHLLNYIPNSLTVRLQAYHLIDFSKGTYNFMPPSPPSDPTFVLILGVYAAVLTTIGVGTMRHLVYAKELGE